MMVRTTGEKVFNCFNILLMLVLGFIMVFPLWNVLMISFVNAGEFYARSLILWPREFTLNWYRYIFGVEGEILNALFVTIALTIVGSIYSMVLTTALAYGLTKKTLPLRNFFLTLITITMFFSGGLVPYYLLIRDMGLMNSFFVLFIPSAINTWNFIVIKSFFTQLPVELEESAKLDGANDILIFFRIVLPLSLPVLATFFLFYGVYYWNSWWPATLFIQNPKLHTLQYLLRNMIVNDQRPGTLDAFAITQGINESSLFDDGIKMATVVVATVPILCVYPFLQKYFTKGVIIGSIKG